MLVDSGYLIALGRARDSLHPKAEEFLSTVRGTLFTVSAVIVETCFFLDASAKANLLDWVHEGSLSVVEVPAAAYPDLAATLRKYSDRKLDFADAALVWLAQESGIGAILTVDRRDFSTLRLKGGKRFRLIDWF